MEMISNTTCTKCQHCGKWTNYANDEHHKAREARIEELENELRYFVDRCEASTIRSRRTYARFKAVLDKGDPK